MLLYVGWNEHDYTIHGSRVELFRRGTSRNRYVSPMLMNGQHEYYLQSQRVLCRTRKLSIIYPLSPYFLPDGSNGGEHLSNKVCLYCFTQEMRLNIKHASLACIRYEKWTTGKKNQKRYFGRSADDEWTRSVTKIFTNDSAIERLNYRCKYRIPELVSKRPGSMHLVDLCDRMYDQRKVSSIVLHILC